MGNHVHDSGSCRSHKNFDIVRVVLLKNLRCPLADDHNLGFDKTQYYLTPNTHKVQMTQKLKPTLHSEKNNQLLSFLMNRILIM